MKQAITLDNAMAYLNKLIKNVEAAEDKYGLSSERYKNRVITMHACKVMVQNMFEVKIDADITDEYKASITCK